MRMIHGPSTPQNHDLKITRYDNVGCALHINPEYELIVTDQGSLDVNVGGENFTVNEKECVLTLPYVTHYFTSLSPNTSYIFMFKPSVASTFLPPDKTPLTKKVSLPKPLYDYFISQIKATQSFYYAIEAKALIYPFLSEIAKQCPFTDAKRETDSIFTKAVNIINSAFNAEITLDSVARSVKCSPASLSRAFRQASGVTPVQYLTALRCDYAAGLLRDTDLTVSEIAFLSGFSTIRNFNTVFKKNFSLTPTEFRNSHSPESEI